MRAPPAPQQKPRSLHRCISCWRRPGTVDEHLARRRVDLVVPAQVAGVVVGDELVDRRDRGQPALLDQPAEQLGVVDDLVVAADLRVLVGERVEAVRAGRDDLRCAPIELSVSTFCMASIWKRNSLPSRRAGSPVQVSPAPRIANSTPGRVQQLGDRPGGLLGPVLQRAGAADPEQVLDVGRDRLARLDPAYLEVEALGPLLAGAVGQRPTGCPCSRGCAASRRPRTGTPTRSAPGSGACRRCGRRARCRPGTARRRRRRWCTTTARPGR